MKITIDFSAIAHRIRRTWWRRMVGMRVIGRCADCGKPLSTPELEYYGHTCERCEGIAFHVDERPTHTAVPAGWVAVPRIGTRVSADHPVTCLNPEPTFEVQAVQADASRTGFAVRGENTCWFGISMVKPADGREGH